MPDCDFDDLLDGEEILVEYAKTHIPYITSPYAEFDSAVYFTYMSNPWDDDTDGDGYSDAIDVRPRDYDSFSPFGCDYSDMADDYYVALLKSYGVYYVSGETITELKTSVKAAESKCAHLTLKLMMNWVNECACPELVPYEDWLQFCKTFNKYVEIYDNIDEELHYFRTKLNRAPATLDEMIDLINSTETENDKWIMCSPNKGRYHMFGESGTFNIKFISSNNTDNMYEAIYDINGNLVLDDINLGTYNYASSSSEPSLHKKFDVDTYDKWKNTQATRYSVFGNPNDNVIDNSDGLYVKGKEKKAKDPQTIYDGINTAKNHYIDVCTAIGIDYDKLIVNEFSIVEK